MKEITKLNNREPDPLQDQRKIAGYLGLGNIAETLEAISSVSIFLNLLKEKSCLNQFSGHRVQTLFVPTNEAIKKLGLKKQKILEQSSDAFTALLDQLSSSQFFLMGDRTSHDFQSIPAASKHVRIQNIPATNGVIHIIDNLKPFQIGI